MISFWTAGTSQRGISTERSPRATITPSKAFTICSRRSTASGFSILAITLGGEGMSLMRWRSWIASSSWRTKESAT